MSENDIDSVIRKGGQILADSIGTKEASERWGYSQGTISKWCREGKIEGASHDGEGSPWHIPKNAECPRIIKTMIRGESK